MHTVALMCGSTTSAAPAGLPHGDAVKVALAGMAVCSVPEIASRLATPTAQISVATAATRMTLF